MSDLLEGVRVVECAVLFNGDTVGMHLADMGADVIKVESPEQGDYLRDMLGQIAPHQSPAHLQVNKNKRSLTLDLRRPDGLAVFWDLLRTADVFVDGFLAGACDKLGIGYGAQRDVRPDIVYCHYSGFGATGPYARIPTHGQMMNALAAAVPLGMDGDGLVRERRSTEPMGGTTIGGDGTAAGAVHAAMKVVAALVRRNRTGAGCYLDAAGSDGVIAQGWIAAIYGLNDDRMTDRRGLRARGDTERSAARYNFYATADDRFVLFCAIEPKFWQRFCDGVGRTDLVGEPQTAGPVDFAHHDEALRRELQTIFATRSQTEWIAFARDHRLPLGPAHQTAADLRADAQLASRQIIVDGEHPQAGSFTYVGEPVIVDGEAFRIRRPAPLLGEHTDELLRELGRTDDEIARLRGDGIV
jgi:crotonobetainyl-CoA:carnitine CoA-transferase CaiB-like acyl-CoA transferase